MGCLIILTLLAPATAPCLPDHTYYNNLTYLKGLSGASHSFSFKVRPPHSLRVATYAHQPLLPSVEYMGLKSKDYWILASEPIRYAIRVET